ncbi:MAG: iron-containing alcohol dehydrogenase [Planctomycetes bacterium]|nr:iron-containing alcohol dehydrogenase [Planctomycetota bacterium]
MTAEPTGFDYLPRTRVVYGQGALARVGELTHELGVSRVMLVTDPGVVKAGHAERALRSLETAGLHVTRFERVKENPTTREVDECLAVAKESRIDGLVGLGGGSAMDTAKGCNFLITNGGRMQDYWGVGKATREMLPLVCIPTTAGTGSECQSFALIADAESHQKMACGDPKASARVAILDPELTLSQPRHVAANTGIDALTHAVESAVTNRRNELSWLFAREAFVRGRSALPAVLAHPEDVTARGRMQWAAALAGMAIENSMLGAAHSAANPLTAHYGIVHGQAVGAMLPHVVRFNARDEASRAIYAELAVTAEVVETGRDHATAVAALIRCLEELLDRCAVPRALEAYGVERAKLPTLAREAAGQWTAQFNPRPIAAPDFLELYEAAYGSQS